MEAIWSYISQGERPIEIIRLFVTAAIAYFTVTWSLTKFLKEKKWERKSEAYSKIIEALHHLKRVDALFLEEELEQTNMSDEKRKEILIKYSKAKDELEKYADMGRYYISEKAIFSLEKLQNTRTQCQNDFQQNASMYEIYDRELAATKICLEEIKEIAIKEVHK